MPEGIVVRSRISGRLVDAALGETPERYFLPSSCVGHVGAARSNENETNAEKNRIVIGVIKNRRPLLQKRGWPTQVNSV